MNENGDISLIEIVYIFWKRKIFIILTIILCLILGGLFAQFLAKPTYEETCTLLLLKENVEVDIPIVEVQVNYNQRLISTYVDLATTKFALEEVIDNLNLDTTPQKLKNSITVTATTNSELITISVENKDSKLAADIANEISKVLIKNIDNIYENNYLVVIDEAEESEEILDKEYLKYMVIFVGIGICIDIFYILIDEKKEYIKNLYQSVKNKDKIKGDK